MAGVMSLSSSYCYLSGLMTWDLHSEGAGTPQFGRQHCRFAMLQICNLLGQRNVKFSVYP